MDTLARILDHHLALSAEIMDRLDSLDDAVLDRPIECSVGGIDRNPTLRSVCERLVSQLEMWVSAVEGSRMPAEPAATPAALRRRLNAVAPRFRELLMTAVGQGRANETFLDATCDPPESFTYGGVLAHVLTFSAVRRTMALGALRTAGITDLGWGDSMHA